MAAPESGGSADNSREYEARVTDSNIPVPDPTRLTTALVDRALAAFREVMETRLSAMDTAIVLAAERLERIPAGTEAARVQLRTELERDIYSLREVMETRLEALDRATVLVAEKLDAQRDVLRKDIDGQIVAQREVLETRLSAIDRATDLRIAEASKMPDEVRFEIDHLKELHSEKFSGISLQFAERDVRTSQAQQASDQALNAALQAAKELVNAQGEASSAAAVKSETSFTKQIDQIGTIISTLEKALDARITELKERIDRGEGQTSGTSTAATDHRYDATFAQAAQASAEMRQRATVSTVIAGISALIAIAAIITIIALHK